MTNIFKLAKNTIKNWYLLTISGIIFIGLGIWVFTTPEDSYVALAAIFSVAFLLSGISEIIFSVRNRKLIEGWGWNLASGILGTLMGLVLVAYPEISITTLPFIAAFVVMYRSIFAIVASFELRSYGLLEWGNLLVMGIIGLILSFMLFMYPVFTGFSLVYLTGATFVVSGIYSIYYSIKLKKIKKKAEKISDQVKNRIETLENEIMDQLLSESY